MRATSRRAFLPLAAMLILTAVAGCSSSDAPRNSLSIAATYHLRSIGGVSVPISQPYGEFIDSGHVRRVGSDTIWIERYSHAAPINGLPGIATIARGSWLGKQSGDMIVLYPLLASTVDTLFVGHGDTLTRHTSSGVELYVAP
jgi:hypothetical protein